jgi:hypothetical protein
VETIMIKSLFAGATALILIGAAAMAQEAYPQQQDRSTTTGGMTESAPAPVASVDPRVFDPTRTSHYRLERKAVDGQTVEKTETTTTTTTTPAVNPGSPATTTYSRTTVTKTEE